MWVYDLRRDLPTRLTFGGPTVGPPWGPNRLYVVLAVPGVGIFQARADGVSPPQLLVPRTQRYPMSFTPDGKRPAFWEYTPKGQIWAVPLEDQRAAVESGTLEPFLESNSSDSLPSFSPDGRWLPYTSDESGEERGLRPRVSSGVLGARSQGSDIEQRRPQAGVVGNRARPDVPVRRSDHGRELPRERRHVRARSRACGSRNSAAAKQ